MHKQCPSCQQLLDENARFCPICGASVSEVRPLEASTEFADGQLSPPPIPEGQGDFASSQPSRLSSPPQPAPANLLKPAFLGGIALGVLSALPVVNCCCFLWVGGGGLLAVYLLRQEFSGEISPGLGAKLGLMTGLLGALFWQVLELPISYITHHPERVYQFQDLLKNQNIPAESLQLLEKFLSMMSDPLNPIFLLISIFFKILFCGIFTMIGGILGTAFWGKPKLPN